MMSRDQLRGYQERGCDFIKSNRSCALWEDVGLGKSVSAATAYLDLRDSFEANKCLIIAPLRVARNGWPREFAEWEHLSGVSVARVTGTVSQRIAALQTPADVHVVNRENVEWLADLFVTEVGPRKWKQLRRWFWDMVIVDEAHNFKAQTAHRWQALKRVRKLFPRMVQLTASPSPDEYEGIWAQIKLLDKGYRLGQTEGAYKERFFDPPERDGYTWTLKDGAAAQIQDLIKDLVFTLRESDYLQLPPVITVDRRVNPPGPAMAKMKEMQRKSIAEIGGHTIKAINAGVLSGKLLQLANGAIYTDDKQNWVKLHETKIVALMEMLEELGDRNVMICYGFKHDKQRIGEALTRFCGSIKGVPGLVHAVRTKKRTWEALSDQASEDRWNAGETNYLLMHPASGGEGTNLHRSGCENIIWFGLTNNLVYYLQANGRLFGGHRREGKNGVIQRIVAEDTFDEEMIELINRKDGSQNGLLNALARRYAR